jgi:hypothetical protein
MAICNHAIHGQKADAHHHARVIPPSYMHHLHDLLEQEMIPKVALFEAFYNYCFVPKHTIDTQLLTVRRDKRECAAFAVTQKGGEGE